MGCQKKLRLTAMESVLRAQILRTEPLAKVKAAVLGLGPLGVVKEAAPLATAIRIRRAARAS